MKNIFLLAQFMACASTLPTHAAESTVQVTVRNTWNTDKQNAPVVLNLSSMKKLKFVPTSAVVKFGDAEIPSQLDDLNGDAKADELAFICDIKAGETQTYSITFSDECLQKDYTARVYADMMLEDKKQKHPLITAIEAPGSSYIYSDLHHHGPAFESELTAYRIYFDKRQNIDLYGKRKRQLEIAETHFYATEKHLAKGYGCDVLWAGSAIGCGTFRPWSNQTRMGDWNDVALRGERIVCAGPVRTIVEVKDMGFNPPSNGKRLHAVPGGKERPQIMSERLNIRTYYTLYAGHRDIEVCATFDAPLQSALFCTGVQKIGVQPDGLFKETGIVAPSTTGFIRQTDGIAASWGSDYPEMGQKELFKPETVGLAVYVPEEYVCDTVEDELNYLFVLSARGKTSLRYYVSFCAAKEEQGYATSDAWFDSLPAWKSDITQPLSVKVK